MSDNLMMVDVILHNMQKMEDHIAVTKRKLHEVQEAAKRDDRETISLLAENKEIEKRILHARHKLAKSQTNLSSNLLFHHYLEEEMAKVEEEKKQCLQELEAEMGSEMEAAGTWTKTLLRDHFSMMRLDNPAIPARREAITQEVAQLTLEETRLNCEIKVLEDSDKEKEKLEKRVKEEEEEEEKLRHTIRELKEKSEALKKETHLLEERRDFLQECPSEEQEEAISLGDKLNELQQEKEYLKAALEAMKKEWKQMLDHYGLSESPEDTKDSQPTTQKRGRGSKDSLTDTTLKKPRTYNPTTTTTTTSSFSTPSVRHGQANSNLDMDADEYINEMLRDINWDNEVDLLDSQNPLNDEAGKVRTPKRDTGASPSTPRTFTRNPAPPTPNTQDAGRSILQNLLANLPTPAAHTAPTPLQESLTTPSRQHQQHRPLITNTFTSTASTTTRAKLPPTLPSSLLPPHPTPSQSLPQSLLFSTSNPRSSQPMHRPPPPFCPFLPTLPSVPHPCSSAPRVPHPGVQSGPGRSVPSTTMQDKGRGTQPVPSTASSSSSLVYAHQFQRPIVIPTTSSLGHVWHTPINRAHAQAPSHTLRNGTAPGTSVVRAVRAPKLAVTTTTTTTTQQGRDVHFSSLTSTITPRLHHSTTPTPTQGSVLPGRGAPAGRGQHTPQGPQQQGSQQHNHQQRFRFGMWKKPKQLTSPSKRRIRFNEMTEVLGTPDSTDGR